MKVINLISGPRNLSTALMYSFAQRKDLAILDEPFYGYYLKNANLKTRHPSQEEVLNVMELSENRIVQRIHSLSQKSNVFVKGMAHHYLKESPRFILDWKNVLLIRHPRKVITSFSKVIQNPTLNDIGSKKASEIFMYLKKNNKSPLVIDSDELLKNPEAYLTRLCSELDIPFMAKMLHWSKGGIPEDGIWAKDWYAGVHDSEGFKTPPESEEAFPSHLQPLLEEALPYYEGLKKYIIKND